MLESCHAPWNREEKQKFRNGVTPSMGREFAMIRKKTYLSMVFGILLLFGLYMTNLHSYLLFHSLAEIFSIVVACSIFMLAWNSRRFLGNTYLLFIGIAYLFIGGLDLTHTLAYKGMGVFAGYGANLPTQLWIAARYVESLSLLTAVFFLGRKLRADLAFLGYGLAISLLLGSIFLWNVFPICFIDGVGLTPFKKISEYIISLILLGSIAMLLGKRREFDAGVLRLLVASIAVTIVSELAFTFYVHVYGLSNAIGHYLKIISFYLIYKAIVETGLTRPYALLFRNLKQSEEALRVEKQFTDDVIETLTDTFYIFDPEDGKGLRWNKILEEMSGYNYNDMRHYPPTHFYPPEEHRRIEEAIKTIQEKGRASVELTYTTKDGRHIPFEYSAVLIKSPKGKPWICAIGRDITERKCAEAQIIRAKEDWERTFDSVPDLIMIVDNQYRIVRINKAMADRLDSTPKDLVGQICYEAVHGTEEPPPFCPHHHLMTDGLAHSAEVREDRLEGDFLVSVDPLHDPDGKLAGSVHVAREITDRKRAEETLRKAHDELEQRVEKRTAALKEEVKERTRTEDALRASRDWLRKSQEEYRVLAGKLLSAQEAERRVLAREMHDDLTQRLAVLAIDAGKLEMQIESTPGPIRDKLREMKEGMVKLSADVHAISRQLHPSILDDLGLVDAIKSECDNFTQREGIVVTYRPKGIPPTVPRDIAVCIYRIIQEGLRNIAKHAQASKAQISLVDKDDSIHLSIKDTGIGFDPTQVKKKTGLGLASMEERVRLIQGDFSIQSKRGQGTVIRVRAPLSGA